MTGIGIAGRGIRAPQVELNADGGNMLIRIDDDRDDELWFTVRISREKLIEMVEAINAADAAEMDEKTAAK